MDADFDGHGEFSFERWCGNRLRKFPEPEMWCAIMRAKALWLEGHAVMIWREHIEGKWDHVSLHVNDDPDERILPHD